MAVEFTRIGFCFQNFYLLMVLCVGNTKNSFTIVVNDLKQGYVTKGLQLTERKCSFTLCNSKFKLYVTHNKGGLKLDGLGLSIAFYEFSYFRTGSDFDDCLMYDSVTSVTSACLNEHLFVFVCFICMHDTDLFFHHIGVSLNNSTSSELYATALKIIYVNSTTEDSIWTGSMSFGAYKWNKLLRVTTILELLEKVYCYSS